MVHHHEINAFSYQYNPTKRIGSIRQLVGGGSDSGTVTAFSVHQSYDETILYQWHSFKEKLIRNNNRITLR